jgi:hypothetical protein
MNTDLADFGTRHTCADLVTAVTFLNSTGRLKGASPAEIVGFRLNIGGSQPWPLTCLGAI